MKITVKWIKEEHWEKPKGYLCINENDAKCLPIASPYWNKRMLQDNYLIVERSPFIPITYAECVVKGVEQALEHGFEMDEKAQEQYNYWNKRYVEELELNMKEKESYKLIQKLVDDKNLISKYTLEGHLLYGDLKLTNFRMYHIIIQFFYC